MAGEITATFVRDVEGWTGDARLFRLSKPVPYEDGATEYVIVSASGGPAEAWSIWGNTPETAIFPSDAEGRRIGSALREPLEEAEDHAAAIKDAGWTLAGEGADAG